jgi:hypothetical protein
VAESSDPEVLDAAIEEEARHYAALGQVLHLHGRAPDRSPLDPTLLRLFRQEALERIFRLLGLRYDQRDIYDAYLGITSPDPALQDSAIEFVDNLVDYDTRRFLLPLLEDTDSDRIVEVGAQFFDHAIRDWDAATRYLRAADDPRLTVLLEEGADAEVDTMLEPEEVPDTSATTPTPASQS